jgi:hypothetical protein
MPKNTQLLYTDGELSYTRNAASKSERLKIILKVKGRRALTPFGALLKAMRHPTINIDTCRISKKYIIIKDLLRIFNHLNNIQQIFGNTFIYGSIDQKEKISTKIKPIKPVLNILYVVK